MENSSTPVISGFGLTVVDILMQIEDGIHLFQKNPVDMQMVQLGGVVPTALVTLARLGLRTHLYTAFGNDKFSEILLDIFKKENVEITEVGEPHKYQTPLSIVAIDKHTGERTGFNSQGDFPKLDPSRIDVSFDKDTSIVLIDGHNPAVSLKFIQKAHETGVQVLLDLGNPKDGMEEIIRQADILIVPQAYWKYMWPNIPVKKIMEQLLEQGNKTIILTMGSRGCMVGDGTSVYRQPAFDINVIDTNGAGDIFFGAFVYGLAQKWDFKKITTFAAGAAGYSCQRYGKQEKIPKSVADIENFISTNRLHTTNLE